MAKASNSEVSECTSNELTTALYALLQIFFLLLALYL